MRSSISALAARQIGGFMRARPARIDWSDGVASFTFDDFPKSALTVGGAILERHGARGTYYTAMRLAGTDRSVGRMFDPGDVVAAHRAGHEIACHTYSHLDCRWATTAAIAAEADENRRAVVALLGGADAAAAPTNFAYPYGAVSLRAKRALASRFASCRGTGEGINRGAVDLADLLVVTLYAHRFDEAALRRRIDEAHAGNAWIIFYTHDIAEQPSEFGCTPDQLAAVVAYAAPRLAVLPVRQVIAEIAGSDPER
jgi:peptidoglycan/xylan/chitin deacetylase (PgdA/CDA1 family)